MEREFEQTIIRLEALLIKMMDEVTRIKTYNKQVETPTVIGDTTERGAVIAASKTVRLVRVGEELIVVPIEDTPTIIPNDDGKLTPVNIPSLPR